MFSVRMPCAGARVWCIIKTSCYFCKRRSGPEQTAPQEKMEVSLKPRGVCSRSITMDLEDGIVRNIRFTGGCPGNTVGLARMLEGMEAEEVVRRLKGVRCGFKSTSCPDQLACGLEAVLAQKEK